MKRRAALLSIKARSVTSKILRGRNTKRDPGLKTERCSGRDLNPSRWLTSLGKARKANMIGRATLPEQHLLRQRVSQGPFLPKRSLDTMSFINICVSDTVGSTFLSPVPSHDLMLRVPQ